MIPVLLWLVGVAVAQSTDVGLSNFYAVDFLADGQAERRFYLHGTAAKETVAVFTQPDGSREGAVLRQMTDGRHLMQLIYDADDQLDDCQYVSAGPVRDQFLQQFADEFQRLSGRTTDAADAGDAGGPFRNVSLRHIDAESDLPSDMVDLLDFARLRKACRKVHRRIRRERRATRQSDAVHGHRRRRNAWSSTSTSAADELMRVPHTKWCGRGNRAASHRDLGGYAAADRCCRQHDEICPYYIEAWQEKYHLYNSRSYTAMHCTCDDRFRSCLKQANTAAANFVGKLFFNVIQTQCFVLKPEKVCKKSSWWGTCQQFEWKKKAHLRDPLPY